MSSPHSDPLSFESLGDLGGADLGPTPVEPGRRGERVWRFERDDDEPLLQGPCADCGGTHVPNRSVLDEILRKVQRGRATPGPCTCHCCAL